jgi:hypothetical protein
MIAKLFRLTGALVSYVCIATVIALAGGIAYLWQTDRLNDEKVFRMVALFHDVDLQQIAETQRRSTDEVPPEELSLDDILRRQQFTDRNFEAKLLSLRRGRQEFDHRLQLHNDFIDRYDRLVQDWENRLKQEQELSSQKDLATVVSHLEAVDPPQAKEELLRWIEDERMDDAILLMSKMSESRLKKLLKEFQSDDELNKLYEIHQRIIDNREKASSLQKALADLKALSADN